MREPGSIPRMMLARTEYPAHCGQPSHLRHLLHCDLLPCCFDGRQDSKPPSLGSLAGTFPADCAGPPSVQCSAASLASDACRASPAPCLRVILCQGDEALRQSMAFQVALDQRPVCPPDVNLPIPVLEHGDKASARQHGLPVVRSQSLHCVVSRKGCQGAFSICNERLSP